MTLHEITHMSLVDTADAIAARQVSSVEVVMAALERVEALQPRLNCFIALEADEVIHAAKRADAELARGQVRGPLHGIPLAHKDMFYRAGKVCSCGSKIRHEYVPNHTATVINRLEAAGALYLGRLNMAEFAVGPTGHNEHFGACRNPWNPEHITGGSSSGSGCSVAARLVYGALGSDTGGSVRLPAAMCGLVGFKPTQTRVSRYGMMPLSFSLDQAGPLARTVRDAARLLKVVAGADPQDLTAASVPVPDYEALLERPIKSIRIGVPSNYYYDAVTDEVRAILTASLEVFKDLGAEVIPVEVPDHDIIHDLSTIVLSSEASTVHRQWLTTRPEDYSDQVRSRIEPAMYLPVNRYLEALDLRGVILERFMRDVFARVDVLHAPVLSAPVPSIEETDVKASPNFRELIFNITRCTRSTNFLGLPALSVPAGFTAGGLPVAYQLMGRPFAEARLLCLGHAYQQATNWHLRAPDLGRLGAGNVNQPREIGPS